MRVTGAQGLSRAGLTEHLIALIARWGKAAVLTYIRKAPLPASHHLAAVVLAGWDRNASAASSAATVSRAAATVTTAISSGPSTADQAALAEAIRALDLRVKVTESQLGQLVELRLNVAATTPSNQVEQANLPTDEVPDHWKKVVRWFLYVSSIRSKVHRVAVGYPEHPRHWRAYCGWQFGISDVAEPVRKLPACHKAICDRCFKAEKEKARAVARVRVSEVRVDAT